MDKIKSYLGFSQKSGSLIVGYNNLEVYTKKVHLIIFSSSLGENTVKKLGKLQKRFNCKVLKLNGELLDYVGQEAKIVALTNFELAKAVLNNTNENFSLYFGGETDGK